MSVDRTLTIAFIGIALLALIGGAVLQATRDKDFGDLLDKAMVVLAILAPSPLSKTSGMPVNVENAEQVGPVGGGPP